MTQLDRPESDPVGPPLHHDRGRLARLRSPLLLAGAAGAAALALHVRDPHSSGSWGVCPWLLLTGTWCPGCGSLRAVHDLTDGDVAAAVSSNLLLVLALPVLVLLWARWTQRAWSGTGSTPASPSAVAVSPRRAQVLVALFAVVAVVFGVLRNLPAGSWLAP
jgi:hypothetical protein